jgi:hypothetical protein
MVKADPSSSPTGRNQWDALVDFGAKLGEQLGPARLLAVIIVILVLGLIGGSVYAIHVFNEQGNANRKEIINAYKESSAATQGMMRTASETVTGTYTGLGQISDKQIENLKKTIELQTQLTRQLEQTAKTHDELSRKIDAQEKKIKDQQIELDALQKFHAPTVATLGALGSLVDEAPELLRAQATKPAVQQILGNSEQLLVEVTDPEAQYPRLKILLAFADLSGFIGAAAQQEKLADKALVLAAALRAGGRARAGMAADEAFAHVLRGNALRLRKNFAGAIKATDQGIRLYDVALAATVPSPTSKLRQRKAEAYVQLGRIVHLATDNRDKAVHELNKALAAVLGQAKEEDIADADRVQSLAWIHMNIAEVELEQANPEAAAREYQTARALMQRLGEAVNRRAEWREGLARIYNGSAQQLVEGATYLVREPDAGRPMSPEQTSAAEHNLAQAFGYLDKARVIAAEELVRDADSLIWQGVDAWTLHNVGLAKLARSMLVTKGADLDESLAAFRDAEEIRDSIAKAAPTNGEWKIDWLWTQICRNGALAERARRDQDYAAMAELFSSNVPLVDEALKTDQAEDWRRERARNRASYADALVLLNRQAEAHGVYTEVNGVATEWIGKTARAGSKRLWQQLADRAGTALRGLR